MICSPLNCPSIYTVHCTVCVKVETLKGDVCAHLYSLMRNCWSHEEDSRPNALEVNNQLSDLLEQVNGESDQTLMAAIHDDISLYSLFAENGWLKS